MTLKTIVWDKVKNIFHQKSVFVKLLSTYCTMGIVASLLIGMLSSEVAAFLYRGRIKKDSMALLTQYSALVEKEVIVSSRSTLTKLLFNYKYGDVREFFYGDLNYGEIYLFSRELSRCYEGKDTLIRDIYMYRKADNSILSAKEGLLLLDTRENSWWAWDGEENIGTGWKFHYYDGELTSIQYCQRVPIQQQKEIRGCYVLDISLETVQELLKTLEAQQPGKLVLADEFGNVITADETAEQVANCYFQENGATEQRRGNNVRWEGEKYDVTACMVPGTEWSLLWITNVTDFYKDITILRRIIILTTAFCILMEVFLSFVMSERVYKPVRKIVESLQ